MMASPVRRQRRPTRGLPWHGQGPAIASSCGCGPAGDGQLRFALRLQAMHTALATSAVPAVNMSSVLYRPIMTVRGEVGFIGAQR